MLKPKSANKIECCSGATLPLHQPVNQRMYLMLTV